LDYRSRREIATKELGSKLLEGLKNMPCDELCHNISFSSKESARRTTTPTKGNRIKRRMHRRNNKKKQYKRETKDEEAIKNAELKKLELS